MSSSSVVGFVGSRSLAPSFAPLVRSVVSSSASSRLLAVGCCVGADSLALSAALASGFGASCLVFSAFGPGGVGSGSLSAVSVVSAAEAAGASVLWWSGGRSSLPLRARLVRRSCSLVSAVASAPSPLLCVFLASPSSRGSLIAARLAVSAGVRVVAFPCGFSGSLLPSLGSGSWSPRRGVSGAPSFVWVPASLSSPFSSPVLSFLPV